MARRFLTTTTPLATVVLLAWLTGTVGGPGAAAGQMSGTEPACSAASLEGTYGVLFQGFAAGGPIHLTGVARFDGAGRTSGDFDEMVNGALDASTFAGDYGVETDCTGLIQLTEHHHQRAPDHHHRARIVVVDGGREAFLLLLDTQFAGDPPPGAPDPSFTISGTLKRL